MVVASFKSLLQSGQVMHAAMASLFTLTTRFAIPQKESKTSTTYLNSACLVEHLFIREIYVHYLKDPFAIRPTNKRIKGGEPSKKRDSKYEKKKKMKHLKMGKMGKWGE